VPLVIRLLGVPSIERDGVPVKLSGRKPWALLAMLALERRPMPRQELIDRLTPEADDPQAALRWVLHTVRRAVGPEATVADLDGRPSVPPRESASNNAPTGPRRSRPGDEDPPRGHDHGYERRAT
jgi:hypothetical protein